MTTYTTRPNKQWPGYVDVLADGQARMSSPAEKVQETIAYLQQSEARHWGEALARLEANDPRLVIADGHAYSIGSDNDNPRGFGGQRWIIRFHDGREVITHSLWHLGDIPASWRDRLPENAELSY